MNPMTEGSPVKNQSILVVVAHPDDETMLAGGTLALASSCGWQTHLLCATRGEGGEMGEPPVCSREDLPRVREQELHCAAQALGVTTVSLLDCVDPLVGPDEALYAFTDDENGLAHRISTVIERLSPDYVLTHGSDGEYGHPGHQVLFRAAFLAVTEMRSGPALYTFAARVPGIEDHLWNQSQLAHLALDIRPWLDAKEEAALCYVTQHTLFKRRRGAETIREVLRTVESFHCHHPRVDYLPEDRFADMLIAAGAWYPTVTG